MGVSQNIHSYADVHSVLVAAQKAGMADYRLPTKGNASHWIQRTNAYVKLLAETKGVFPFTGLIWRRSKTDPCLIHIGPAMPEGVLTGVDGELIEPELSTPQDLFAKGLVETTGSSIPVSDLDLGLADLVADIKKGVKL